MIDIDDAQAEVDGERLGPRLGALDYESLLAEGDPAEGGRRPDDEWDAISLNYTSGTTGNPKGVLYHHRGAYLNALGNALAWGMSHHPVYLWTLPMFHCNGWCFPWTDDGASRHPRLPAPGRRPRRSIRRSPDHGVTHLCGAPIVMQMMLGRRARGARTEFDQQVKMMTAAAPPPAAVLAADGRGRHSRSPTSTA